MATVLQTASPAASSLHLPLQRPKAPPTRILELSQRIAANTAKLNEYLESNNLPTPSFAIDGPLDTHVPKGYSDIDAARNAIIDDAEELRRLVLGPKEYIMSYNHDELLSQQAIARYGLVHSFPLGKQTTFAEMAKHANLPENNIKQFIRHATIQGFFHEPRPGVIEHNAVTHLLAQDDVLHDWLTCSTNDMWQAASRTCEALDKWPGASEAHQSGFSMAHGEERTFYEIFNENPERGRRFASAMKQFTEGTGFELFHITDNYPWADLTDGVVVDVGGSAGHVCFALATTHPNLSRLIVQDLPETITTSQKSAVAIQHASRVHFMAHNFFTPQPILHADIYYLRWILHNWSDENCIKILRNLIPALKPNHSKIIVNDNVLPSPLSSSSGGNGATQGGLARWQESRLRSMDLTMMEIQNAREREIEDWKRLFELGGPGFVVTDIRAPVGSTLWIIVAEWRGGQGESVSE